MPDYIDMTTEGTVSVPSVSVDSQSIRNSGGLQHKHRNLCFGNFPNVDLNRVRL